MRCYLMKLGGSMSPEGLEQQYRELRNQVMMLEVERSGLHARRNAIFEHIRKQAKKVKKELQDADLEAEHYAKTLEVYRNNYLRLQHANQKLPGSVPQYEIELARSNWEQYQIEAQRDLRKVKKEIQEKHLAGLSQHLMDVDIETATVEAKLLSINKILERLKPEKLLGITQKLEDSRHRLEKAREQRNLAMRELDKLKRLQAECKPPKVIVIDEMAVEGKDRAKGAKKKEKQG